jgi:TonB family protein
MRSASTRRRAPLAFCFSAIIALGLTAIPVRAQQINSTAQQIIDKARDSVSYSLAGPFEMRANIKLAGPKGALKGTYLLDWAAPDKFREEIHYPGYDEVKIASGTTMYVNRNVNYTPLAAFRINELMDVSGTIGEFQSEANQPDAVLPPFPRTGKLAGEKLDEETIISAGKTYCFYPRTAVLIELCTDINKSWPTEISLRSTTDDDRIRYSEYTRFGAASIPRKRQYFLDNRLIAEADVKSGKSIHDFSSPTFARPSGGQELPWCYDEIPAEALPLKPALPVTPEDFQNPEILDAFSNADGTPSRIQIIGTGGPATDAAMQKLAPLIHFTPATCGGKPVKSEFPFVVSEFDISTADFANSKVAEAGKDGASEPKCAYCPNPEYTDNAFQEKLQGYLLLDVLVSPDGKARYVRVVKHLGLGLDQAAVRIIRDKWRFKPALGPDGKPAMVRMLIEVDFHLY